MSEQKPNQTPIFSSFADWCKHKNSLSEEARHTLEILLQRAGTSDCYEANQILSSCTELTLSSRDISDVSPLSNLTNLTTLYLDYNQISDLSPLSGLIKLRKLYLYGNQISDLSPLSRLTKLTHLYLYKTHIADLDGFDLDNSAMDEFYSDDFDLNNDIPKKEPVYLLKMTCPSTGNIHALRVPPDMQSARQAIRWINWGIDPEEFSVQT